MNRPARRRSSKQQQQQQQEQSSATATPSSSAQPNNNSNTMDGAHRKIELQSPEDLTYLITNVRRAAAEHLSEAFPPVEGDDAGEDELRVRIEQIVDEYISQTFTLAAPNLCINGFDLDAKTFPAVYLASPNNNNNNTHAAPEEIVQFEPFDARKRARVEELAREEEDLMREIATLKKTVPAATAKQYAETFWSGLQGDQEGFEAAKVSVVGGEEEEEEEVVETEKEKEEQEQEEEEGEKKTTKKTKKKKNKRVLLEDLGQVERQEDVEKGYRGVVETLGRLKREMPATVARMERARVAGEYVLTER
ncbi:hypothetical protein N0V93_008704 [Gnomoniopsis smithogilvyi]|uniref:Kinetochore protein mis14 n=1 Tax=Gnomoniopsis smithogilvyi TaxID=1191159 RepID=A0A9W9CV48_9PEZI|nr:hypothetical protein N0V93_008704 [Gnomoniopsis smithogilvyi]